MTVWDGVEMEFFDPKEDLPIDGAKVIVVLKDSVDAPWRGTRLLFCLVYIYKKAAPRFASIDEYGRKDYRIADIKCWGRLKE